MREPFLFPLIRFFNYVGRLAPGKALVFPACLLFPLFSCTWRAAVPAAPAPLEIMLDNPPATLNPRMALDATGQRLDEIVLRALTRMNQDLIPQPDLSLGWVTEDSGRRWSFTIRPGQTDQSRAEITPARIAACLENYRIGAPPSPFASAFPGWLSSRAEGNRVVIRLSEPNPYLASDLSLLRYFTTGDPNHPCEEPLPGQTLVASGDYRPVSFQTEDLTPDDFWLVVPRETGQRGRRPLRFSFVADDNSRVFRLMRGEVDATQYSLSASKTDWLSRRPGGDFNIEERDGVTVSYLSFNLRDPILADARVRRAIALAIDRESYVRNKLHGYARLAGSLLSPQLPESSQSGQDIPYDPARAGRLLDQAGYLPDRHGIRLRLRYKTTPQPDNLDQVLAFQGMLRRVGIDVEVDVVELSVFLASIRKGAYQLYSSRWTGVSNGSILRRTLHTGSRDNRAGYHDEQMDHWLDEAMAEPDLRRRTRILRLVQRKMMVDLPYFPLWYWKGVVFVRKGLHGLAARDISLSGSLEPLTQLR